MNRATTRIYANIILLFVAAGFLCGYNAFAQVSVQDPDLLSRPIDEIVITGNKITQEEIILREMKIRPGEMATEEMLEADRLRILGLDIFSRVEFVLNSRQGRNVLQIKVTEEWYIFPLPYWNLSDDEPPEVTYGFRYLQKNFRGRAETLKASVWGGYDRGFRFAHVTPWMKGTPSLIRSIGLYQKTEESRNLAVKDLGLEARHTVAQLFFGKRWTVETISEVGTRFRLVQADNPLQLATGGDLDRMLEAIVIFIWDGRDLRQLPRKGAYLGGRFTQGWLLSGRQRYQRLALDFRYYHPTKFASICSRLQWHPGWGNVPPYDWIIVESTSPIRSSKLSDEGKSFIGLSVEARFDIFPLRYYTWKKAPYFKSYFRNLKYGLAGEIFIDGGDAYTDPIEPTLKTFMWGYGVGLLLRVPYVDVVRLESSWNPDYSFSDVRFSWKVGISF